ncbi:hypothetical protein GCM10009574_050390 [Streptomyces asiaticus]|uniref:Uncharacterized protein n=1 Tax=Streptomyces rhizosphaericus TaxID=114699 RepID=A0ABP4CK93_9ACTN
MRDPKRAGAGERRVGERPQGQREEGRIDLVRHGRLLFVAYVAWCPSAVNHADARWGAVIFRGSGA